MQENEWKTANLKMSMDTSDDPLWAVQQLKVEFRFRRNSALVSWKKKNASSALISWKNKNASTLILQLCIHISVENEV